VHELSLCNAIRDVVDRAADGRTVDTVHLQVGKFRQVVPETLCYCWELVTATSALSGSTLAIDHVDIRLRCAACTAETTPQGPLALVCADCGSGDVSLLTGEEFLVTSLDLKES
jgi:hydrogenase nickel incorporation protein HypA/HybF